MPTVAGCHCADMKVLCSFGSVASMSEPHGMARALWIAAPGIAELRDEVVEQGPDDVVVETGFSGISRGTEALVLRGGVPRGGAGADARRRCRRATSGSR